MLRGKRRPPTQPEHQVPPTSAAAVTPPIESGRNTKWIWLLPVLVVLVAAGIRGRLLDLPLERDEGEYAYAAQLILQGETPYRYACTMKLPGTHLAYAFFFAVFGQTRAAVHLGLILVNSLTIILTYLVGRRLIDAQAGVAASVTYGLMSLGPGVLGLAAHATHFIALFAVAGTFMLLVACDSGRLYDFFASGLLFGLAFLMKQHGIAYVVFGLLYAVLRERQRGWAPQKSFIRITVFGAAAALPFGLACFIIFQAGDFDRFWFWTFTYAREYASQTSLAGGSEGLLSTVNAVIGPNMLLWLLAGLGLLATWYEPELRGNRILLTALLAFSFLCICPGLYFRDHYFIVVLPAIALLVGAGLTWINRAWLRRGFTMGWQRAFPMLVFVALLVWSLLRQSEVFFELPSDEVSRRIYPPGLFVEAVEIGRYIRDQVKPGDCLAVIGSEPELYFYTGCRSATCYMYMYPLMEERAFALTMQQQMIAEIEAAKPRFLVVVYSNNSWGYRPRSHKEIGKWVVDYSTQHYDLIAVVDMGGPKTKYSWAEQARLHPPQSTKFVLVYQRRPVHLGGLGWHGLWIGWRIAPRTYEEARAQANAYTITALTRTRASRDPVSYGKRSRSKKPSTPLDASTNPCFNT
jgi:4-amino-4-deoxy-L-arabinose transferase-like glycosyltransferase